ncbi:Triacylglycerol lipase 2 [Psilocybe cubensis]|uniref:Triacylglycerol lipase 2 n=1 Tax=Psilocybe cubensis TaxID=181762 RepID=A0ACB8HFE6_PSICU|nr:Triacylglycerol lipase 2 [Psilocybe cubensis]KAH9486571.1 Triacylglycerol lipase 2 [Psilocybe cubensis]
MLNSLFPANSRPRTSSPQQHQSAHSMARPVLKWVNQRTLGEAINTPLPTPPAPARLPPPPSFRPSHLAIHPPPFCDNLTRATLPTASLSPPLPVENQSTHLSLDPVRPPPILRLQSKPTRSSLDSLRSVSRPSSTYAPAESTSALSSKWWFQSDALNPPLQKDKPDDKKTFLSPRNPVVFCHGLLGFDSVTIGPAIAPFEVTHWRGIKEVLEENGTEVLITRVPATSSPVDRAKVLEQKISSGGLDCRYLTTHLTKRKFQVLSITTIATPHRGSAFADHFLSTVGRARMPSVLSLLDLLPNGGGDGKAFECLTIDSMRKFNQDTPDVPGVRYFSWGAGTYLGTLSQVNHLDLVGWINTARYKWAEMMGKEIKFRPATFYLGIVDMLAREVEGQGSDSDPSKAGAGVDLEEEPTSRSSGASIEYQQRTQMLDSLDTAGADVHDARASTDSRSSTPSLRKRTTGKTKSQPP